MHDIPKMRDVSVFTMVMNRIIGRYHWFIIDDFLGRRLGASSATEFFNGLLISFESSFDGFCGSLIPKSLSRAQAFYIMADRLT